MYTRRSALLVAIAAGVAVPLVHAAGCWGPRDRSLVSLHHNPYGYNLPSPYRRPSFNLMGDIFSAPFYFNSLLRQADAQLARAHRSAPRYDIAQTESGYELSLDVPGVRAEDISVTLEDGGRVLRVSGDRNYRKGGSVYSSKFDQMFTIDEAALDVDGISVRLSDGVLFVAIPKKPESEAKDKVRRVPIMEQKEEPQRLQPVHATKKQDETMEKVVDPEVMKEVDNNSSEEGEGKDGGLNISEEEDV